MFAIVSKEARRQIASPSAWAIVGAFALLSGVLYTHALDSFLDQSSQAVAAQASPSADIARLLIRPLFVRLGIAVLLTLPLVVWRAATRLRTTDDLEASFLGAIVVHFAMLLVTAVDIGLLFAYGRLQWLPVLTGYVGLLLVGLAFISVGLLISRLVTRRLVSLAITEAIGVGIATATWWSYSSPAAPRSAWRYLSIAHHLDDFAKGVLDSGYLVLYVSLTIFGLWLTARSLESPAQT